MAPLITVLMPVEDQRHRIALQNRSHMPARQLTQRIVIMRPAGIGRMMEEYDAPEFPACFQFPRQPPQHIAVAFHRRFQRIVGIQREKLRIRPFECVIPPVLGRRHRLHRKIVQREIRRGRRLVVIVIARCRIERRPPHQRVIVVEVVLFIEFVGAAGIGEIARMNYEPRIFLHHPRGQRPLFHRTAAGVAYHQKRKPL